VDADRQVEKAKEKERTELLLLINALRSRQQTPGLDFIPSPDSEPLLNSGDPKRDRLLEKGLEEKSGRRLRREWM
jgi:hypothetical protein